MKSTQPSLVSALSAAPLLRASAAQGAPEDEEQARGGEDAAREARGIVSVEWDEGVVYHRRNRNIDDRERYRPRGELKPRIEHNSRNKYEDNSDW